MWRLQKLVCESLRILTAQIQTYSPAGAIGDAVVDSSRLILLAAGRVRYGIEGRAIDLTAPTVLLVPAWTRRQWRVIDEAEVELLFCEFTSETELPLVVVDRPDVAERAAFLRMVGLANRGEADRLCAVLELKAALGRVLASGTSLGHTSERRGEDTAIEAAMLVLDERLADASALAAAREAAHLDPIRITLPAGRR